MKHARNISICILLIGLLGGPAIASEGHCENLFESQNTTDTSILNGLFPALIQIQSEITTNPQGPIWRQLNRRLDRLYLNVERSDFLKTASDDLLFSMALRLIEIQKELETGPESHQLRIVFAEAQQDTIQDVKSRIYSELRTRGTLLARLTKPAGPLTPHLRRDLLLQFGFSRSD